MLPLIVYVGGGQVRVIVTVCPQESLFFLTAGFLFLRSRKIVSLFFHDFLCVHILYVTVIVGPCGRQCHFFQGRSIDRILYACLRQGVICIQGDDCHTKEIIGQGTVKSLRIGIRLFLGFRFHQNFRFCIVNAFFCASPLLRVISENCLILHSRCSQGILFRKSREHLL